MKMVTAGALVLSASLAAVPAADAQTLRLGESLVFYVPELRTGVDSKAFETHVNGQIATGWNANVPGTRLTLVRKDRGSRPGQYQFVWTTDTLARRKGTTGTGEFPFNAAVTAKAGDFRPGLAAFTTNGRYIEYQLVAPNTVGTLPEVDVLGLHYIKVKPDQIAAFDRFVATKLHAAVGNLRPDLRLLYYKPTSGEAPGNYVTVIALTKSSRDKYWPKGADSDDVKAAFNPAVTALATELQTYLVPGSWGTGMAAAVYESKEWADWVLLN
jgi:hypothetical protein